MPKRRVITAKQRAASRANLEKARKAKRRTGVPRGKVGLFYHNTSPAAADRIVKEQFLRGRGGPAKGKKYPKSREKRLPHWGPEFPVFFTNRQRGLYTGGYGREAQVSVKLPYKGLRVDGKLGRGEISVVVDQRQLAGKKIKRTI